MVNEQQLPAKKKPLMQNALGFKENGPGKKILTSEYVATVRDTSGLVKEFVASQNKWFFYIDEVEGVPATATGTKVRFSTYDTSDGDYVQLVEENSSKLGEIGQITGILEAAPSEGALAQDGVTYDQEQDNELSVPASFEYSLIRRLYERRQGNYRFNSKSWKKKLSYAG